MEDVELYERFLGVLLERVRETRYPSPTMLDRTEQAIRDRDTALSYLQLLIETVDQDRYPSPQMLDRITRLLDLVGAT